MSRRRNRLSPNFLQAAINMFNFKYSVWMVDKQQTVTSG